MITTTPHIDHELMEQIQTGDRRAAGRLYERFMPRLVSHGLGWGLDEETAKDLAHDTFVKIITRSETYRPVASVSTWIFTIYRNTLFSRHRKLSRFRGFSLDEEDQDGNTRQMADPDDRPLDQIHAGVIRRGIDRQIRRMSPEYRDVLVLREWVGLSYQQVGEHLDISPGTVKSRISRARQHMKSHLNHLLN